MIVTDLDGTLFRSDKSVSEFTLEAIRRIREKGISFTVNTGRSYAWLGDFIPYFGIECPLICSNGCEIVHGGTGQRIYTASLSYQNTVKSISYCIGNRLSFFCETPEGWILPSYLDNMDKFIGFYPELPLNGFSFDRVISADDNTDLHDLTVLKVVVWVTFGNEGELMSRLASNMSGVELIHSARDIYELLPADNNKGKSFLKLCSFMNISPEECCALGDFDNDLPMLEASGLSIAMANAPEYIREKADYVTDTNNNDGVAKALNSLFLN